MDRQQALHQRAAALELSPDDLRRYSRHLLIPGVGLEGQKRLRAARVLVVGAGGLGAPILHYLTAAGVGALTLIDPDRVEVTNLQRQVLFGEPDLGRLKVEVAAALLRRQFPSCEIRAVPERLDPSLAEAEIGRHDLVLDATDNFAARYLINDACFLAGVPEVYGSIYQFDGRVSVFWRDHGPCYRCLHPDPPDPESVPGCGEGGVLGALPGVIGSLMALEAMKWIAGSGEPLLGRLAVFDGRLLKWREMLLHRDRQCALCGDAPRIQHVQSEPEAPTRAPGLIREISPRELRERIAPAGTRLQLIDVRQPGEFELGHLPGAVSLPLDELAAHLPSLDSATDIVLYCKDERRTRRAYHMLMDAGFDRLYALEGGIDRWREEIDPALTEY